MVKIRGMPLAACMTLIGVLTLSMCSLVPQLGSEWMVKHYVSVAAVIRFMTRLIANCIS